MGLFDRDPKTGRLKKIPGNTRLLRDGMRLTKKRTMLMLDGKASPFPQGYWPKPRRKKVKDDAARGPA